MVGFLLSDGVVALRSPRRGDAERLVAGRDEAFHRWIGRGSDRPDPAACVVVTGEVVGWVDYDHDAEHDWLGDDEVNLGYNVFAEHRRNGYATRAVALLIRLLERDTDYKVASLLVDPQNAASLAVAERCCFVSKGELRGQRYYQCTLSRT